jgi:hypothetical protein
MLSVFRKSVIKLCADYCFAECHFAKCHYNVCHILSVILSDVILNVVMLIVVAPPTSGKCARVACMHASTTTAYYTFYSCKYLYITGPGTKLYNFLAL